MSLGRGSVMTLRSHWRMMPRALRSAPLDARNLTISGWRCAEAHINAVCWPKVSRALTSAPASMSSRAASTRPLRAAAISGVSPSGFLKLASAPAFSSRSMIGADPRMAASVIADVPKWFFALTSAPAFTSARTSSTSSLAAAHISAVVPSGPGVFGFAPLASMARAAARSPRSTISSSPGSAAAATEIATNHAATTAASLRTLYLGEDAAAVADLLHRDVVPVEDRRQQIREARVLRVFEVLAALDLAVGVTEDGRRQRVVVVLVAVAHVAAEEDGRVVQHRAARLLRLRQPLHELREHFGVIALDLHQLGHLLRVVAVVRQRVERL